MEISAALGVRARVPELPRPNPRGLAARLLRHELRPVTQGQANLRPRQHLPFPSVPSKHGMNSVAAWPTRASRTAASGRRPAGLEPATSGVTALYEVWSQQ